MNKYYLLRDKEYNEDNVIAVVVGGFTTSSFNERATIALEEHFDVDLSEHPLNVDLSKIQRVGSYYAIDVEVYGIQNGDDVAYDITIEEVLIY